MSYVTWNQAGEQVPERPLEKSTNGHAVPRFSIYKPFSNEKVDTLKHCFMTDAVLKRTELPANLCPKDGLVYTAVYDSRIPEGMEEIPVVISFQQHTYGRFAVIRVKNK